MFVLFSGSHMNPAVAELRGFDALGGSRDSLQSSGPSSLPPVSTPLRAGAANVVKAAAGYDEDQCKSLDEQMLQSMQTDKNKVKFGLHEMRCD